jgi:hypothetical protein
MAGIMLGFESNIKSIGQFTDEVTKRIEQSKLIEIGE